MSILIVGAMAGLGRALANRLAKRGNDLVLVSSDLQDLRPVASDLQIRHAVRVRVVQGDVGQDDRYLDPVEREVSTLGSLDGLLSPIGGVDSEDDGPLPQERVHRLMRINFYAVHAAIQRFRPIMEATGSGTIVGFGSVAPTRGRRRNVVYSAAKRALESYFESLRHSYAGTRIRTQFYKLGYLDTIQCLFIEDGSSDCRPGSPQ